MTEPQPKPKTPPPLERYINPITSSVIVVFTVLGIFVFGALFSYQYEKKCERDAETKELLCTENQSWNGVTAIQTVSGILGGGAGILAALAKAGVIPGIGKIFGGSSGESE